MANPFSAAETAKSGKMEVGDVRTVVAKDKEGNVVKTIHINRTARDYCYDLCDAYNEALTNPDLQYYVDSANQVRLGHRGRPAPKFRAA
jgi:hypothetical protein